MTQFLPQIASKIHFRSTCLLMMLYFTLDFTKQLFVSENAHLETSFSACFGCFLLVVTRKRTLIGWLVLEDQISTNHWKNPNWGRWFRRQFRFFILLLFYFIFRVMSCFYEFYLIVLLNFVVKMNLYWSVSSHHPAPDCFQPKYDRVSHQRRAPPAGSTATTSEVSFPKNFKVRKLFNIMMTDSVFLGTIKPVWCSRKGNIQFFFAILRNQKETQIIFFFVPFKLPIVWIF